MAHDRDAENANFTQGASTKLSAPPQRALRLCRELMLKRPAETVLKSCLFVLLMFATISCGTPGRSAGHSSLESSEAMLVEDSGAKLSGDYDMIGAEDDYAKKSPQGEARTTFRFKEDGTFAIERGSRTAGPGNEEGTYVISKRGELVLYVEKVGADARSEARAERYLITDQRPDLLKLQRNPSSALTLQKR